MKITKYEHACLDIAKDNTRIIIDPGVFSKSLTNLQEISGLVITHIHGDHFDKEKVEKIISDNPDVKIWTTNEVANELGIKVNIAKTGKTTLVGNISLEFFGEKHAEIDPETPVAENTGVLVDNALYYPGDSFTECSKKFNILAVPSSAPWLRVGQTIPIIKNSTCEIVFPTHDTLLSDIGYATTYNWLQKFSERNNKTFKVLSPGESLEV